MNYDLKQYLTHFVVVTFASGWCLAVLIKFTVLCHSVVPGTVLANHRGIVFSIASTRHRLQHTGHDFHIHNFAFVFFFLHFSFIVAHFAVTPQVESTTMSGKLASKKCEMFKQIK